MRPNVDDYFIGMARLVAMRGTCLRRHVGCVLVNMRNHVLSTGYNGRASGQAHCNQVDDVVDGIALTPFACKGAHAKTGTQLDECEAIHAEQNALLQCRDIWEIETCYVTASPCITCAKLLLNTSCRRIVYLRPYTGHLDVVKELWSGRVIEQYTAELEVVPGTRKTPPHWQTYTS